jgi:hypothetical protein
MRKALFFLALASGCEGDHRAHVECAGSPGGLSCTVTHQEGSKPVNACWAVALECAGGLKTQAKACQVVQPMGKAIKMVAESDFPNMAQCTAVSSMSVVDIKLAVVD